jgi:hypothetical protein
MDEAVQLIAERIAKGPAKPKGRRAKSAGKAKSNGGGNGADAKPVKASKAKKPKAGGTREAAE